MDSLTILLIAAAVGAGLLSAGLNRRRSAREARAGAPRRIGLLAGLGLAAIGWYQRHLSARLPTQCRYTPTCSRYGVIALRRYGLFWGGLITAWRIMRCNPLSRSSGWDPVPDRRDGRPDPLGTPAQIAPGRPGHDAAHHGQGGGRHKHNHRHAH